MRFPNLWFFLRVTTSVLLLGITCSSAQADPLTTFTFTDLGPGNPTFATGANGGIVIAGNGQTAYPFQTAQDTSFNSPQSIPSDFPLLSPPPPASAPGAYNDPAFVYSTVLAPVMANGNGFYVAIDATGVGGHGGASEVYCVKQNPDGTWGSPTDMLFNGGAQYTGGPNPGQASIIGINKLNEVLGTGAAPGYSGGSGIPQSYLYNLNTNTLVNLNALPVWTTANGWSVDPKPIALDNQGRILLDVGPTLGMGSGLDHTILLTPEGVTSDPLAVPTPEPGGLALVVGTLAALAVRRVVRSRR